MQPLTHSSLETSVDANEISTVLSIYEILFLHLFQYSVGRGIGGNLQVFTDDMPVLLAVTFYRI
jgi:hypothetical protein